MIQSERDESRRKVATAQRQTKKGEQMNYIIITDEQMRQALETALELSEEEIVGLGAEFDYIDTIDKLRRWFTELLTTHPDSFNAMVKYINEGKLEDILKKNYCVPTQVMKVLSLGTELGEIIEHNKKVELREWRELQERDERFRQEDEYDRRCTTPMSHEERMRWQTRVIRDKREGRPFD